mmetsp:Transcript_68921/g.183614  ORF Transcript_68921/g.183614 Transcript_68921/m.183614 type:complete len:358 (+) Transcript_68921:11-1084(+)
MAFSRPNNKWQHQLPMKLIASLLFRSALCFQAPRELQSPEALSLLQLQASASSCVNSGVDPVALLQLGTASSTVCDGEGSDPMSLLQLRGQRVVTEVCACSKKSDPLCDCDDDDDDDEDPTVGSKRPRKSRKGKGKGKRKNKKRATTTTTTTTVPTTTVEETTPAPLVEGQLVVEQTCSEGGARAPGSYRVQVCPSLNVNVTRVSCNGQEVTIPAGEAVELTGTFAEGESVVCTAPYPLVSAGQLVWSSSGPCEGGCPAPGAVASVAAGDVVTPEESGTSTEVIMGVVGAGIALVFCLAVALLLICSARNAKRYVKKEEKMRKAMSEEAEKNAAEMKKAESMEAGFTDPNMVRIAGC